MQNNPAPRILLGNWDTLREHAVPVRHRVFVIEQSVPIELELDELDAECLHAVALDASGAAVGTGRLLPDGHIGRMAVLAAQRGTGVGGRLLEALVEEGWRRGHDELALNAQTHARSFYEAHGFHAEGDEFMEAGIPHVLMVRGRPSGG